jgi:hypothetical protein
VVAVTDEFEDAWYRVRDRALEELLVLGATLSDAQIDEFIAALDKRQRKYERKYLGRSDARSTAMMPRTTCATCSRITSAD